MSYFLNHHAARLKQRIPFVLLHVKLLPPSVGPQIVALDRVQLLLGRRRGGALMHGIQQFVRHLQSPTERQLAVVRHAHIWSTIRTRGLRHLGAAGAGSSRVQARRQTSCGAHLEFVSTAVIVVVVIIDVLIVGHILPLQRHFTVVRRVGAMQERGIIRVAVGE